MYHKSEVETLRKEIAAEKGKTFWFGRTISDLQSKLEQYAWNIAQGDGGRDKTSYMWKEILEKIEMEESAREEYFSDKGRKRQLFDLP